MLILIFILCSDITYYNERQRLVVWSVAGCEALVCQATTTFNMCCAVRR